MTSTDYREAFHTEIKSFLKNLCKTFEDDRDLMMITSSLLFALQDDPDDQVISQFYDTVSPFKAMIETRDPVFFYEVHIHGKEYKLLSKLHLYWEQLSPDDKKVVWDYIEVLFVLARKVV
jgi:hypothetical protein